MSMRCGRLQMIPPLGGGEKAGITRFLQCSNYYVFQGGQASYNF